jgi:hypothetical protein
MELIQAVPVWDCEVETEIVETPLTIYATGRLENHIQHLTHESQHNAIHQAYQQRNVADTQPV